MALQAFLTPRARRIASGEEGSCQIKECSLCSLFGVTSKHTCPWPGSQEATDSPSLQDRCTRQCLSSHPNTSQKESTQENGEEEQRQTCLPDSNSGAASQPLCRHKHLPWHLFQAISEMEPWGALGAALGFPERSVSATSHCLYPPNIYLRAWLQMGE